MNRRALLSASSAVATMLLVLCGAAPASAAPRSAVVEGRYLRIVSTADPVAMQEMLPGDVAVWDVSISADAPEPGRIDIALSGVGELPLDIDARACDVAWTSAGCASGERALGIPAAAPLDGRQEALLTVPADQIAQLRLRVALHHGAVPTDGSTVLRVHAVGHGDALSATPPGRGELPHTGMAAGGAALLAVGAILLGIVGARLVHAGGRTRAPQ